MVHVEWEPFGEAVDYGNNYSMALRWDGLIYHCSAREMTTYPEFRGQLWGESSLSPLNSPCPMKLLDGHCFPIEQDTDLLKIFFVL